MKLDLNIFKGRIPHADTAKSATECIDGVCRLVGGGEVMLGSPFILEAGEQKFVVSSVIVGGRLYYNVQEMK